MSCLIKKSLFFMVLSIIYSPTFSNPAECIANVRLVFFKDVDPRSAFKMSLFSLTEDYINNMTTTEQLSEYLLNQYQFIGSDKLDEVGYFRNIGNRIGEQKHTFSKSEKKNIAGYFRHLISKFDTISELVKHSAMSPEDNSDDEFEIANLFQDQIMSPKKYCEELPQNTELVQSSVMSPEGNSDDEFEKAHLFQQYIILPTKHSQRLPQNAELVQSSDISPEDIFNEKFEKSLGLDQENISACKGVLSEMFNVTVDEIELVDGFWTFSYCYINYIYLEFADNTGTMGNYYEHVVGNVNWMVKKHLNRDPNLFPTVEEYCSSPPSSSTT